VSDRVSSSAEGILSPPPASAPGGPLLRGGGGGGGAGGPEQILAAPSPPRDKSVVSRWGGGVGPSEIALGRTGPQKPAKSPKTSSR